MKNKIHYVSSSEIVKIKNTVEEDKYIAEINGIDVQKLQDFLLVMSEKFRFPIPSLSLDSYNDWMRDLDWLDRDGYVLIIYNFKDFLSKNLFEKEIVIDGFTNMILPFWQKEVISVVVGGKPKSFMVYLVE